MSRILVLVETDDAEYVRDELAGTLEDLRDEGSTGIDWYWNREAATRYAGRVERFPVLDPKAIAERNADGRHPIG